MGEQVAVEGRIVFEQLLQIEDALGGDQLVEPKALRRGGGSLALHVAVLGVRTAFADSLEDHPLSLGDSGAL